MSVIQEIRRQVLQSIRLPSLLLIDKVNADSYSVDGVILNCMDMSQTGERLINVTLNPLWAGKAGQGFYALPDVNVIALVGFVDGNSAFPFVQGYFEESYQAAEIAEGKLTLGNGEVTLEGILRDLLTACKGIITVGPPPQHKLSATSTQALEAVEQDIEKLFMEGD